MNVVLQSKCMLFKLIALEMDLRTSMKCLSVIAFCLESETINAAEIKAAGRLQWSALLISFNSKDDSYVLLLHKYIHNTQNYNVCTSVLMHTV